jgi:hypothetical protein
MQNMQVMQFPADDPSPAVRYLDASLPREVYSAPLQLKHLFTYNVSIHFREFERFPGLRPAGGGRR